MEKKPKYNECPDWDMILHGAYEQNDSDCLLVCSNFSMQYGVYCNNGCSYMQKNKKYDFKSLLQHLKTSHPEKLQQNDEKCTQYGIIPIPIRLNESVNNADTGSTSYPGTTKWIFQSGAVHDTESIIYCLDKNDFNLIHCLSISYVNCSSTKEITRYINNGKIGDNVKFRFFCIENKNKGICPPVRIHYGNLVYHENKLYLFGGWNLYQTRGKMNINTSTFNKYLDDLWCFDLNTQLWNQLNDKFNDINNITIGKRSHHLFYKFQHYAILFAGINHGYGRDPKERLNDLYVINLDTLKCKLILNSKICNGNICKTPQIVNDCFLVVKYIHNEDYGFCGINLHHLIKKFNNYNNKNNNNNNSEKMIDDWGHMYVGDNNKTYFKHELVSNGDNIAIRYFNEMSPLTYFQDNEFHTNKLVFFSSFNDIDSDKISLNWDKYKNKQYNCKNIILAKSEQDGHCTTDYHAFYINNNRFLFIKDTCKWLVFPFCGNIEWKQQRIVWIGFYKNQNNDLCLIKKLPLDVIKHVLRF